MKKLILLLTILLLIGCNNQATDICKTDSDCDFLLTNYSREKPCSGCMNEHENYVCATKEKIISRHYDIAPIVGSISCEECEETDKEEWACKCIEQKCIKKKIN